MFLLVNFCFYKVFFVTDTFRVSPKEIRRQSCTYNFSIYTHLSAKTISTLRNIGQACCVNLHYFSVCRLHIMRMSNHNKQNVILYVLACRK